MAALSIGAAASYFWFVPRDDVRQAILNDYLAIYCHHALLSKDPMFLAGNAAALSRIIIKAGIGPLALAEYGKCRVKQAMK